MRERKPVCTIAILAINMIVFIWLSLFGMTEDAGYMLEHGAMYVPYLLENGEYYRLVTSMFLHFGFTHLMNNMIMLYFLGSVLEEELGRISYLLLYLLSGLGGNLLSAWFDCQNQEYVISAGASGAIFGVIGALLWIVLKNHGHLHRLSGRGMVFMVACSLYHGFTSTGVDNMAHIGGLVTGFILAMLLYHSRKAQLETEVVEGRF